MAKNDGRDKEIEMLYERGLSAGNVARKLGVSKKTVLRALGRRGVKRRATRSYRGTVQEDLRLKILELSTKSANTEKIAELLGIGENEIIRVLQNHQRAERVRKITKDDRATLLERYLSGEPPSELAREYGISAATLYNIRRAAHAPLKRGFITTEEWIRRARARWGNKYNYSRVKYIDRNTDVEIICPEHGAVLVSPEYHIREIAGNTGCTQCGIAHRNSDRKFSFEDFLVRAKQKYGDKFKYDETSWTSFTDYITYACPMHGLKRARAYAHLSDANTTGCDSCGRQVANDSMRTSFHEFITRAGTIHGNKYTYHEEYFRGGKLRAKITCPLHGIFYQIASSHMAGAGCPRCAGKNMTTNIFVERASVVHKNRYSYDRCEYVNSATKIYVTCPIHGDWEVSPLNHLHAESGCPECAYLAKGLDSLTSFLENPKRAQSNCEIYIARLSDSPFLKIGISIDSRRRDAAYVNIRAFKASRAECWCVEQFLLIKTLDRVEKNLPEDLRDWKGRHELRKGGDETLNELEGQLKNELALIKKMGWIWYAESRLLPNLGFGWGLRIL